MKLGSKSLIFLISLVALAGTEATLLYRKKSADLGDNQIRRDQTFEKIPAPLDPGPISFRTSNGGSFRQDDLFNHWTVFYFGYTSCPDVCPLGLQGLSRFLQLIEQDSLEKSNVEVLFVSLDPDRDIPERMNIFKKPFHRQIQALIGSRVEIDRLTKNLGINYSLNREPNHLDYMVTHPTSAFLVSPQGKMVAVFIRPEDGKLVFEDFKGFIRTFGQE